MQTPLLGDNKAVILLQTTKQPGGSPGGLIKAAKQRVMAMSPSSQHAEVLHVTDIQVNVIVSPSAQGTLVADPEPAFEDAQEDVTPSSPEGFPPIFVWPGKKQFGCVALLVWLAAGFAAMIGLWVAEPILTAHGLSMPTVLKYISIPIVSTGFTYCHIWVALWMTFYPIKFIGCCQIPETPAGCGWQGVVPSKRRKMAHTWVDLMTKKILSPKDIFERIDRTSILADELDPILHDKLSQMIETVAMKMKPKIWSSLPAAVKDEIIASVKEDAPATIEKVMTNVKENIDKVFDLKHMVVDFLVNNPVLLNNIFIACGFDELCFIRNCGAHIGWFFGLFQMILWHFYSAGWMLPTFGFGVGLTSNWMALKAIFAPIDPIPIFGGNVVIQGLFLKRQAQISEVYAQIVSKTVLSASNLLSAMLKGPCSDELFRLVKQDVGTACEDYVSRNTGLPQSLAVNMVSQLRESVFENLDLEVGDQLKSDLPDTMRQVERTLDKAMDLETLLKQKLQAMPPADFEGLLHPVFQEDEWILILIGGVLGVLVGLMQWYALGS